MDISPSYASFGDENPFKLVSDLSSFATLKANRLAEHQWNFCYHLDTLASAILVEPNHMKYPIVEHLPDVVTVLAKRTSSR
jgi:hypothetical protein